MRRLRNALEARAGRKTTPALPRPSAWTSIREPRAFHLSERALDHDLWSTQRESLDVDIWSEDRDKIDSAYPHISPQDLAMRKDFVQNRMHGRISAMGKSVEE